MNPYKAELLRHHRVSTQSKHRNTLETKLIDELQQQFKRRGKSGYGSLQPVHKQIETKPISPYAQISRQHGPRTNTHLPSHATTTSVMTPQSETAIHAAPKRQREKGSRPGDEKLHPILMEAKGLEKSILHDYRERMHAREFDKMLQEKFLKYSQKVETYLNKQEEVKTNVSSDVPAKLDKLLKISDKLNVATKAHLNAIGASAEDIKQMAEQTRLMLLDLDQHSKGRKSMTGVGRSGTFHSQEFYTGSKFFKQKLQQLNESVRRIKATNLKECQAVDELKQICADCEGAKKKIMSTIKVSRQLEQSSSPSPSPPPGRQVYSRRNLAHITLNETSMMRGLSMSEKEMDDISQSPDIKGIKEKMKELQEERKELKLRLTKAKTKLQMSESRNKNLKNKIRNLGGNISETLQNEEISQGQVTPHEQVAKKPRIPRLEELRKLHAESLTPTSNSAREMKRDTFGIGRSNSGVSPSSKLQLESLLRENSELQAKVSKYKADTKQDQRLTHHDLKFQIRFMSILELVRRFLSSLRKVQKAMGNDTELEAQKEKLESDKTELENYLKKHYKYLDKKRRQQVEKLQKDLEKRGDEDFSFPQKSLRSPKFQTQNTTSTGFPSQKTVTMSTQFPTKRKLSIDKDILRTQESIDDNSSDIVAHGTPPLTAKSSGKLPKKAFVELAQQQLRSRQVMQTDTEEVGTCSDSRHLVFRRGEVSVASSHGSFSGRDLLDRAGVDQGGQMAVPHNTSNVSSQVQKISGDSSDKFAMMSTEIANLKLENNALKKVIESTNREKMKSQQDKKLKKDLDNLILQLGHSNSLIEKVERKNQELMREVQDLKEENMELKFNKSQDDLLGTSKIEAAAGGAISTQASAPRTKESSQSLVQNVEKRLHERLEEINLALNSKSKRLSDLERNLRSVTLKTSNVYKKKILEHEEQILSLTDSLKQSTDTLQKVNDEMLKMKTEKVVAQGQLKKLLKQKEEGESGALKVLEGKLKVAGEERDRALEKLHNLQTQVKSLENVINILKGEIEEEQEKVRNLESSITESQKKSKTQIMELNQKLENAQKQGEVHLLKFQKDHKKKEEQKKAEINSLISSHKEEITKLKDEANKDHQRLSREAKQLEDSIKKVQDENSKLKGALKAQANAFKEAEDNARSKISHLEQEIKSQNTLIEQFKESNQSAASWETKLKAREEEFNKLIKALEDQRSDLSFEISVDKPKLEKALQELKEAETKKKELADKITTLESRTKQLEKDIEKVKEDEREKLEKKEVELKSLRKDIDSLSTRENEWIEKSKEVEGKLKGKEKELEEFLNEKEKTAKEIEFQNAVERMKLQELEKLKKDKEHWDEQLLQMQKKLKDKEHELVIMGNEHQKEKKLRLKEMKEQKEQHQNKIQELQTQIAVLKEKEEASKLKFDERERNIKELQDKLKSQKEEKNEVKLQIKAKQLEIEELEMQGFEYKYHLDNKEKELKEMEEKLLAKRKEIEQLEAKMTQIQKDSQKKIQEAQATIFSLRSDNTNSKVLEENQKLEKRIKEIEGKIEDKDEELKKSKKNQEQLLTKIEELESERKMLSEKQKKEESKGIKLEEELKKDEKKLDAEREKFLSKLKEKDEIIKELREASGVKDNSVSQEHLNGKVRALVKKARQYKASLLRERQNYLMLHQDFTQTLNCIKTVATDQMTAYEIEAETSNRKVEDLQKEFDEIKQEKEILEATVKTLERENEVLGFKAKTSDINQERVQELEEMYDAVVNERDAARDELSELRKSSEKAHSSNALKISPQSHPEKKEYTSSLKKDLQAQYQKSNISDYGPGLERARSPQLTISPAKAPIRRSMSPNASLKKRHTIFKTNAQAAIQLKETPSSGKYLRSPAQSPTPGFVRDFEDESKNSGISTPRLSRFGIKLNEMKGSEITGDEIYSPISARQTMNKQLELDQLLKRFNKYKKQNEKEKEQLAANNRHLRQQFEIKADEFAVKMKQKMQRIVELEESVKLISESVRSHACTVQSLTPLTANETEDLKTPDDNQTIQDVLQFAEMRVQRFVALYKEPFEGTLATRKKRSQTMLNKGRETLQQECQDLKDDLTRSQNKNKMLEMEIDELESRAKAHRREIDRLNDIIAKNEIENKRTVQAANKKGERYKEMSKEQQIEIQNLKDKIHKMNHDMETHELKIGVLKHELQQIQSPEEKNKIIKELKKQNSLLTSEIQSYRRNQPSETESFSTKMFGEKNGTLRTPRKCDTDLVLSKLTSSEVKLIQKLVKQDQGNQVWLLLELLITDLGRDQLPGFILLREEDLPGKHYHLLSARVTKKTFPRVKDNERISPLKVKSRLRDLREEKINLVEQMKNERPKRAVSPRLTVNESNDMKNVRLRQQQELIRAKMQRNTWEIEYLQQTQHLQKLSDFIQEVNDAGAAGRYLKEIKVYEQQLAGLRKDNASLRDKIIELESAVRSKEKEIARIRNQTDTQPKTTPTRQEQYSFLDRTFSETDAEMIIYEFEQLERRSGGIASPILTQNEERLKEKILKLEAMLAQKEEALRQVARKVQLGGVGGIDNDSESDKNIRSLFYRFITRCPEFDKERERLLEDIYKALGYKKTDVEDIQESRGIKTKSWKSKKNLLSIFGMKTKY